MTPKSKHPATTSHSLSDLFTPLEKNGFIPLYFQIQTQLVDKIHRGLLQAGEALPGEEELSRIFGVSRMTSRQALQALKSAGLAVRERGRGTFVAEQKVEKDMTNKMGFTAEMEAAGKVPSSEILGKKIFSADPLTAERLGLPLGAPVWMLRRIRFADAKPVAIEVSYVPLERFEKIDEIDFSSHSLYETLRGNYGIRFGSVDEVIEARMASREETSLLKVPARSALLVISRTLCDDSNTPIEVCDSSYRGDLYRATLHFDARSQSNMQVREAGR